MDLQALRNKSAQIIIEFDGERLRFNYNPHAYDDDCQRILHALTDEPDNTMLARIFEKLITSWDLKDGGTEVPCNYDMFHDALPPFLRSKIINAVIEDEMERGKLRGSDNSSKVVDRSALVPIGTRQSSTSNGQEPAATPVTS